MRKFRLINVLLFGALFIFGLMPFAQLHAGGLQSSENVVAIPYNQAIQMAKSGMISSQDVEAQINNIQMLHRDLRDEISRLEAGTFNRDRINVLRTELTELNELLSATMMRQFNMQNSIEFSMQHILDSLSNIGEEGVDDFFGDVLKSVMASTASMNVMSSDIALIQMRQAAVTQEIQQLQNEAGLRTILLEARNSLNELERQIDKLRLHQEQAELVMNLALRRIIVDMAGQTLRIAAMEAELALAEQNLSIATLASELGLISSHNLSAAEHRFAQSLTRLEGLLRSENISLQNLNYLLGQPLSQPTVVTFSPHLPQIPQNPEGYITEKILQSPAIRQLQIDIDSAKGARRVYTGNDHDINISEADRQRAVNNVADNNSNIAAIRNRIALQDAVERAELSLEQAIRAMEAKFYLAYTDFEGLEAQEAALHRELTQVQAALEVAAASFELGRVTRIEVDEARLSVLLIEHDIERILNQKWILAFLLENPSLLQ